ncbi:hypothetical protein Hanom_Chr17g01526191 [Helianthus anomalus]
MFILLVYERKWPKRLNLIYYQHNSDILPHFKKLIKTNGMDYTQRTTKNEQCLNQPKHKRQRNELTDERCRGIADNVGHELK